MPDDALTFRRLLPVGPARTADDLLAERFAALPERSGRPFVLANLVTSVDGRAAVDGRSGGLGDDGDKAMFHGLRERVDAVLVGTGTVRSESYGRMLGREERRARRVERGQSPEPIACLVTHSGRLPLEVPLFACPEARVVVFCTGTEPVELRGVQATVELVYLESADGSPLSAALSRLREDHAVASVLCEGGPSLVSSLLHEEVLDELHLTLAPKLVGGGDATPPTKGEPLAELAELELREVLERDGTLFLRYAVLGDG